MSKTTPATLALHRAGVAFEIVTYEYDPSADRVGMQAAEALGAAPAIVLKTLMAEVDGKPVCVVLPSDREIAMKALARTMGKDPQANVSAVRQAVGDYLRGWVPAQWVTPIETKSLLI